MPALKGVLAKASSLPLILHTGISRSPPGSSHASSKSPAALRRLSFPFLFRKSPPTKQPDCLNLHVSLETGNNAAVAQADPQNIEGLCLISSWMVVLSPGPWGRPDPRPTPCLPPYKSRVFLLQCSAAGADGIWLLKLVAQRRFPWTCSYHPHRTRRFRRVAPKWHCVAQLISWGAAGRAPCPSRHSWGCWMGLEDAADTLQLCPRHRNKGDASLNMKPPRCEGHRSAAAASGKTFPTHDGTAYLKLQFGNTA